MQTIYRYILEGNKDTFEFQMPRGAKILDVQTKQGGDPSMWALVDTRNSKETRKFKVFGTGHKVPDWDLLEYVGTYQQASSTFTLVLHIFEVR